MTSRKILIVAGDYELVHQSRQALIDLGFALQTAFSHRDGVYALRNGIFDAVIISGLMTDKRTRTLTARHLREIHDDVPIIAYLPDHAYSSFTKSNPEFAAHSFSSLDDDTIREAVLRALHQFTLPIARTGRIRGRDDAEYWDIEEVQTFLALTRSLTEILDLSEVLNRVVVAARQLTDAEEGMILMPDRDTQELYLLARVGMDSEIARSFRVKTDDTYAGQVFRTGQPVLIGARGPHKVKTQYFVNALLYVPIQLKGQTLGVLGVNNREKYEVFNSHHETLLLNLAAYAAVAIENARIHGQSMTRARELRALVDASQAFNATLSLENTLSAICEQTMLALGVSRVEVYGYDRDQVSLAPWARQFQSTWRVGQEPKLVLQELPLVRDAVYQRRPKMIRLDRKLPTGDHVMLASAGARAVLILPIMAQGELFGSVLAFYTKTPEAVPDTAALQLAQYLALEALLELLDKTRKFTPNIAKLLEQINELCHSNWCECGLITPNSQTIALNLSAGRGLWLSAKRGHFSIAEHADLLDALETQNIINQHLEGDGLTPGVHRLLELTRGRSLLALPLVSLGQTQGIVVCVDTESSRLFDAREVDLARALVGQASTALDNARLVHDLEASLRELEETQERLIQAERLSAMGELAAAVAHQISNPLTTILADTELLLQQETKDNDRFQALDAILRSGKRAQGVVRRLLAAVHPKDQQKMSPPVPISVTSTIDDTLALVRSHIQRDGIQIVVEIPAEPLPLVLAVPGELEDVWLNLLLNAHDALIGRRHAQIRIVASYDVEDERICVRVSDNGPGVPEAIRQQIFDAFFTTKPVGEGTGLGLHICRQVVQRIGGEIILQDTQNQGACFIVHLPALKGN